MIVQAALQRLGRFSLASAVVLAVSLAIGLTGLGTESPTYQYAYSENVGWIDFRSTKSDGVTVTNGAVRGYAWAENIGWINFSPIAGGGVFNDGTGVLSGYAWGENVGWINFGPSQGPGVFIDACGDFNGYAWGENIGWISMRSDGPAPFRVRTPWVSPIDGVPPETAATTTPTLAAWNNTSVSLQFSATDCGTTPLTVHYSVDGGAGVAVPGSSTVLTLTTNGQHSVAYHSTDGAGNAEAAHTLAINIDKQPPAITLVTPTNSAQYVINSSVLADYTITDATSGVAIENPTVFDGAAIDTSSPGPHMFTVYARDAAGNTATVSVSYTVVYPGNIDPNADGSHFAYAENAGWVDLRPPYAPGLTVSATGVTGNAWGENIGWLNFSPSNGRGGVTNDGRGHLAGYAWSENTGWISFSCTNTSSCSRVNFGVTIGADGRFMGKAWSENIGWISFSPSVGNQYGAQTSWTPPDVLPPVVVPPAPIVVEQSERNGTPVTVAEIAALLSGATVTDDLDMSPTLSHDAPAVFPLGATPVTFTATDETGNHSTAVTQVTVVDTRPPVFGAITPEIRLEQANRNGTPVSIPLPAATDICDASVMVTSDAPLVFPLGETTIIFTATDDSGNVARATTVVRVVDTQSPVLTLDRQVIEVEQSTLAGTAVDVIAEAGAAATDVCDAGPALTIDRPGPYSLGDTPVLVTATDASGNSSSLAVVVRVRDTIAPLLVNVPAPVVVEQADRNGTHVDLAMPSATDACDANVTVTSDAPGVFPLGTTRVTFTATDDSGNTSTATTAVTVRDTAAPKLSVPADLIIVCNEVTVEGRGCVARSHPVIAAWLASASASDVCDSAPVVTHDAPAVLPIGTTVVRFRALDASGNAVEATSRVHVRYGFGGFLPPLYRNGSSVVRQSNQGRSIPVKFRLHCANMSIANAVATIQVFKVLDAATGSIDTTDLTADAGQANDGSSLFRYDPAEQVYVFNLSTRGFAAPATYRITVSLDDGTQQTVDVSLR